MNPQPPKLYSLIKLHKDNYPIRPVVSYVNAPNVKLSKKLIKIIQTQCKFISTHSIKNSLDLVNKIQELYIPDKAILLSFDVKNLFPSIPPTDVVDIVKKLLEKNCNNPRTVSYTHLDVYKRQDIPIRLVWIQLHFITGFCM